MPPLYYWAAQAACCKCGRLGEGSPEFFVEVPTVPGEVIENQSRLAFSPENEAEAARLAALEAARPQYAQRKAPFVPPSPVWVESYCGSDRDCVPDSRFVDSYETAKNGARAWLSRDPSRYVILREKPGGYAFEQFGPEGGPRAAPLATVTRAGQAPAIEIQRGKLSGAFG